MTGKEPLIVKMPRIQNKKKNTESYRREAPIYYKQRQTHQNNRVTVNLSAETLKARTSWTNVFQDLKQNNWLPS
jgi:hypothetical protein